jgi:hypothetical protein
MKRPGQAVDQATPRAGWVAAAAGQTYVLPLHDGAKARRLPGRFVPSTNSECIWIERIAGRVDLYDGLSNEFHRSVDVGAGPVLADLPVGLVAMRAYGEPPILIGTDGATTSIPWPNEVNRPPLRFVGSGNNVLIAGHPYSSLLRFIDLDHDEQRELRLPLLRRHRIDLGTGAVSPDGRQVAITGDVVVGPVSMDVSRQEREKLKRRGSALVIVDLKHRSAELVEGLFEKSAYAPNWSADGKWIFFGAPFESAMFAVSVNAEHRHLQKVEGDWRRAAMPLLDLGRAQPIS